MISRRKQPIPQRKRRRGVMSMELVFTLPILLLLLLGLFEFSMLFFARANVVEASRVAARSASMPGATVRQIREDAGKVLPPRLRERMEISVIPGEHSGDLVTVAVRVPMSDAAPDLLWPVGFGLRGRELYSETSMIRE